MTNRLVRGSLIAGVAGLLATAATAAADVTINIAPPPPLIVAAPPRLVVVPGTPVYYAPAASINLFAYQGRYYTLYGDRWFVATGPGHPWVYVPVKRVPARVRAVPVAYYKIPPGHAKKMGGPHPGKGHEPPRGKRHKD